MSSSFVEGSQTPDLITSSGSASVTTTATMLTASQSYGTFETDDGSVPFRYNTATNGTMTVSVGLSGNYARNLSDGTNEITYDAAANLNRTMAGSTRESSYVGIIGDLSGYHLEKSTGGLNESISVSATDDNGATSATGNFTRSTNGTTDSLTTLSGTDVSQPGVSVSIEFFENGGGKFSDGYSGSFTEDTSESTDEFAIGGMSQSVYGNSVTKTTAFRVLPEGTSLSTSVETTKFLANVDGGGAVQSHDDEIVSQSGQYSSDRFLRATSDQTLFATSSSTEGNTFTTATLFFGSSTKFQLVGGEGASLLSVGDFEQTNGGMHSETTIGVKSGGSLTATVNTTEGSTSETAMLSSSFGSGTSIKDTMGGYFINEIIVVGVSGTDESFSGGRSTISITQTQPGSIQTQTISQTDSSTEKTAYSVNVMQFGDIVGSVSGVYSASMGDQTVTEISSSGNSQSGGNSYWQSKKATITDQFTLSAGGNFYGLEGSNGGSGDQTSGPLSTGNWSVSNTQSIGGTVINGSFSPVSTTIDGIEETGFRRYESTQNLTSTEGVSASNLNPEGTVSSSWTIDGTTLSQTKTASAVISPPSGGGGGDPPPPGGMGELEEPPMGGGGGGNWRSQHDETVATENSLIFSETISGSDVDRTVISSNTVIRNVGEETSDDDGRERIDRTTGSGNSLEYAGGSGGEQLTRTQLVTEQIRTKHEDFVEDELRYENGELQMNDWVELITRSFSSTASGSAMRFATRNTQTSGVEFQGYVNYSFVNDYDSDNDPNSSGEHKGATTASRWTNNVNKQSVFTTGRYGSTPTRRTVTNNHVNELEFFLVSTSSTDSTYQQSNGVDTHKGNGISTTYLNNRSTSDSSFTMRPGKATTGTYRTHQGELELTTHYSTFTKTFAGSSTPLTGTEFGANTRIYQSDSVNFNAPVGYETNFGFSYDSMLLYYSEGGGPGSHWQYWNTTTSWPEGGVATTAGTGESEGGSYDPSSLRQQDGEEDQTNNDEQHSASWMFGNFTISTKEFWSLFDQGLTTHTAGNFYRIQINGGNYIFQYRPDYGDLVLRSYGGPVGESMSAGDLLLNDIGESGGNTIKFWKGYFWTAPKNAVTGAYELIINYEDMLEAIDFLIAHPKEGAKLLGEGIYNELIEKLGDSEGQGEIAGDIALSFIPISKLKLIAKASKYFKKFGKMPDLDGSKIPDIDIAPSGKKGDLTDQILKNGGCFVGETLVQAYLPAHAFANAIPFTNEQSGELGFLSSPREVTRIDRLELGGRIVASNPIENDREPGQTPNPTTWRMVSIALLKNDGTTIEAQLLRSVQWIEQFDLVVGKTIEVLLAEMDFRGTGQVVAIEDCPAIAQGEGNVITGRYVTRQATNLVELVLSDGTNIVGTDSHPFWIPDFNDWIPMGELVAGMEVDSLGNPISVQSIRRLAAVADVFNIEVQGDHVYRIAAPGVLVHNVGDPCPEIPESLENGTKKLSAKQRRERDRLREELRKNEKTAGGHDAQKVIDDITKSEQNLANALEQARINPTKENLRALQEAQDQLDGIKRAFDLLRRREHGA